VQDRLAVEGEAGKPPGLRSRREDHAIALYLDVAPFRVGPLDQDARGRREAGDALNVATLFFFIRNSTPFEPLAALRAARYDLRVITGISVADSL
jgi:hypothetical protein